MSRATARYALDLNNSLAQVLSDGSSAYLYGLGRIAQQNVVGWQYYQPDALGSVRQLTNAAGTVTQVRSYEPYGKQLSIAGNPLTKYSFAGEWQDPTGLIFLRARYYDPYLNQFIQRDTIVPDPRIPADWNKYTYVRDNPINLTDPSGHICLDPWAPSGVHFDPNRGCDYPEGSIGSFWWRRDPLGPDTAIIDMPWR